MRKLITYLIICFPLALFGQHIIPYLPIYHGDIEKVIMKSIEYSGFDSLSRTYKKSDEVIWKTEYEFSENNELLRSVSYYKSEIRSESIYEYNTTGRRVFIKEIINDYGNNNLGNYSLKEFIYVSEDRKQLVRYNIWSYHQNNDSMFLITFFKDSKYDSQNNLKSFNQFGINYKGDTIKHGTYELTYDTLNQLIYYDEMAYDSMTIMIKSDTDHMYRPKEISIQEPVLLNRIKYNYNKKGLMYKDKHELNAKEFYLTDKGYSDYYEFDEKNNWIRLYRKWEGQSDYILSFERKIIYK